MWERMIGVVTSLRKRTSIGSHWALPRAKQNLVGLRLLTIQVVMKRSSIKYCRSSFQGFVRVVPRTSGVLTLLYSRVAVNGTRLERTICESPLSSAENAIETDQIHRSAQG